ncbi:hypothetical protein HETIRDRAFT_119547 [Heterobasidion irregulare TC 32-1]|uniref:Uncharacterized protein n=1 Tax=Heterobasidion irregulare (strain TC 32-1) TaxID=747525 RepID=W4KBX4_HETIT|nr:uncharacterized protein HETIRDRAFT_119547 [Heterobasidion irregulare TC 32-1]ETW82825.1 hypothetical protein HETIRDRAFT_119547 [Heterobasidion irregulare TC 32-1]
MSNRCQALAIREDKKPCDPSAAKCPLRGCMLISTPSIAVLHIRINDGLDMGANYQATKVGKVQLAFLQGDGMPGNKYSPSTQEILKDPVSECKACFMSENLKFRVVQYQTAALNESDAGMAMVENEDIMGLANLAKPPEAFGDWGSYSIETFAFVIGVGIGWAVAYKFKIQVPNADKVYFEQLEGVKEAVEFKLGLRES